MKTAHVLQPVDWDAATPAPKPPTTGHQVVDYLARIHWWVRLFGVLMLAGMALSVLGWIAVLVMFASR